MQDFAMPQSLELEASRRNGIPAIRREVIHNTTTQNEYRPSELCYIPLDTGAAGAFMDVKTTRLELTVVVRNKNFFVDFINLSRCGWHALIQEFGIEINNGIHELNRHYAECVELEMIKMGQNQKPFEITRSNPWTPSNGQSGKMHINFIKPSMVTAQGLPHNVQYPSLTTLTSATTPDTITQSLLLFSNPFLNESLGFNDQVTSTANSDILPEDYSWFAPSSFNLAQAYYDDRLPCFQDATILANSVTFKYTTGTSTASTTPTTYTPNSATYPTTAIADSNGFANNLWGTQSRILGLPHGGSLLASYSKQTTDLVDLNIYNCSFGQTVRCYPPSMWPAKQPCPLDILQKQIDEDLEDVNGDAIMNYYANCKNIPVGIPLVLSGNASGSSEIWGDSLHTTTSDQQIMTVGAETEFHISLKIYSSLIGELARKWFPELVVPQGRMRVRIRFQEPQVLFQTLMDPCRRVPGTSRDWFPYLGVVDSNLNQIDSLRELNPGFIASGIHPIMVSDYKPGDVYIDAICNGTYPIPVARQKMLHDLFTGYDPRNHQSLDEATNLAKLGGGNANSTSFLPAPKFGCDRFPWPAASDVDGGNANFINNTKDYWRTMALALNMYHYETRSNGEYGYPIFRTPVNTSDEFPPTGEQTSSATTTYSRPTKLSEYWNYTHPERWDLRYHRQVIPLTTDVLNQTSTRNYTDKGVLWYTQLDGTIPGEPKMKTDPFYDWRMKSLNWNPFCFPTPQYLPLSDPSDKRTERILQKGNFVNENQTCFGTHREHSVAQVRRTHTSLYPLQIPDSVQSRIDERITYIVKNVQIVTQQIVLPRTAALSIIENALSGGISMETRAWKEMESMLPRQETQKALINMAAAFCTDITFVFRPIDIFQGDRAYGYNSFSFYNPFTSFSFAFDSTLTPQSSSERDYNYLGGRPIYYNECIIQQRTGFDIQLQLSAELLPRQPIDTIRKLIQHIRWGDQVFSDRDYMQLNPHLHPSYGSQKGMVVNTLQDGFWACFVPISALDDQTITDNPFFVPAEISAKTKIRGKRAPINSLPFTKPFDGTFHLSFNLEAFMGQNEKIRTGVPIVNNNMFLKFDKAHMIRDYDTQLLTVASCDARVVFERGGTMQFFT